MRTPALDARAVAAAASRWPGGLRSLALRMRAASHEQPRNVMPLSTLRTVVPPAAPYPLRWTVFVLSVERVARSPPPLLASRPADVAESGQRRSPFARCHERARRGRGETRCSFVPPSLASIFEAILGMLGGMPTAGLCGDVIPTMTTADYRQH